MWGTVYSRFIHLVKHLLNSQAICVVELHDAGSEIAHPVGQPLSGGVCPEVCHGKTGEGRFNSSGSGKGFWEEEMKLSDTKELESTGYDSKWEVTEGTHQGQDLVPARLPGWRWFCCPELGEAGETQWFGEAMSSV